MVTASAVSPRLPISISAAPVSPAAPGAKARPDWSIVTVSVVPPAPTIVIESMLAAVAAPQALGPRRTGSRRPRRRGVHPGAAADQGLVPRVARRNYRTEEHETGASGAAGVEVVVPAHRLDLESEGVRGERHVGVSVTARGEAALPGRHEVVTLRAVDDHAVARVAELGRDLDISGLLDSASRRGRRSRRAGRGRASRSCPPRPRWRSSPCWPRSPHRTAVAPHPIRSHRSRGRASPWTPASSSTRALCSCRRRRRTPRAG
jgi:hypothetical protein